MSARDRSLSEQLAAFVAGLPDDAIPEPVAERAKRHILDTLGAALAGSAALEARRARAIMQPVLTGGSSAAGAWGTALAFGPRDAAFVNGVAAHALELDDAGGCDHSGAVVLPASFAALACSERRVSGRAFIAAVVLGYDVGRRVLEACGG